MTELDETDLAIIAWLTELVCVIDPPPVRLAEQVLVALDRTSLPQAA
ncbi:hypothetical protein [Lentzea kentuckyensis]|nr:hypothetical protein [Lentzea kentuckyensis]